MAISLGLLGCGVDTPVADRPDDNSVTATASDAGRSVPADSALPARPVAELDARVTLPIDSAKPLGDAGLGARADTGVSGPVGPVVSPGDPVASDAAVPDAGSSGHACDAKVGPCAPSTQVGCDARKVLCKRAPPSCQTGQVPAVVDTCWGECVAIEQCACTEADACPDRDHYICHMSARHCGPYVN